MIFLLEKMPIKLTFKNPAGDTSLQHSRSFQISHMYIKSHSSFMSHRENH